MHKRLEPGEKSVADNRPTHSGGSPPRLHRGTDMTMADDIVQLPVTQFEEALCLAIGVVFQSHCPEYRILIGNRNWRPRASRDIASFGTQVFGASERSEAARGILLEKLCPTLDPL